MDKLSRPRRELLQALVKAGGSLKARQLTVPARGLATRMQSDGLVQWEKPTLDECLAGLGQSLHITDAGRIILISE
jgi:hypothetical protein